MSQKYITTWAASRGEPEIHHYVVVLAHLEMQPIHQLNWYLKSDNDALLGMLVPAETSLPLQNSIGDVGFRLLTRQV